MPTPHLLSTALPYSHLNLKRNPFGIPSQADRPMLTVTDVSGLASQLLQPKTAIQFVGGHGRGKSSHLFALQKDLSDRLNHSIPYARLRDPTDLPTGPIVLLDEGAHLYRRAWWRLRRVHSIAISTHITLKPILWMLGFSVQTVRIENVRSAELRAIFERRLEWARRGAGPIPTLPESTLQTLLNQYGDDIRSMESALYASIERLSGVDDVHLYT
jgi:hypothetical protein